MPELPPIPSFDELDGKVKSALAQLVQRDGYLLQIDANERAISHRLGIYLQALFEDWDVDCEYNRNLDDPKRIKLYKGYLAAGQPRRSIAETDVITVFPDMIIHKRGTHHNLLVIEMKKTTSQVDDRFDRFKLENFKYQLGYPYAMFVKVICGSEKIAIAVAEHIKRQDWFGFELREFVIRRKVKVQ